MATTPEQIRDFKEIADRPETPDAASKALLTLIEALQEGDIHRSTLVKRPESAASAEWFAHQVETALDEVYVAQLVLGRVTTGEHADPEYTQGTFGQDADHELEAAARLLRHVQRIAERRLELPAHDPEGT